MGKIISFINYKGGVGKTTTSKLKSEFGVDASHNVRDARFYIEQRSILKKVIDTVKDKYDYILIDRPPNLYLVTQNSLAASDYYIITTIPDHLSTIGIEILTRKITALNEELVQKYRIAGANGKAVTLGGILFTMVRTAGPNIVTTNKKIMHDIHEKYGELCFKNHISWGTGYVEAAAQAAPVFSLREENAMRVAEQYKEVTKEFLQKVNGD